MATMIIPWPVFVNQVVYKKGTRTKNGTEIETETYLVYIKKSKLQQEPPLPLALYKGTHDALIAEFEKGTWEDAGEDKVLTSKAIEALCESRAKEWDEMSDDKREIVVKGMDVTIPRRISEEDKKKLINSYKSDWVNLPSDLRTSHAQNGPENGDFGIIFGNLPIDGENGTTQFYVLNKGEIILNQKGEKVTQTHDRVCAIVKMITFEDEEGNKHRKWMPLGDASSFEEALRLEVINDIGRKRFEKVETQEEALARLSAALGVTSATETPEEAPTETPAEETSATT